ncbi:MAG: TetR/AcrR family transcriptional regulator, partial [Mameliella sp.]|nr:TetR/AcrR family transcriptional regulator [Mameliella sp.]
MTSRLRLSAEERRTAILDAAARLLASQGWETITVNEILSEAGISKGGFYHHFKSKDDILEALVLRFADAAIAAADTEAADSGAGFVKRIEAYVRRALLWELDHVDEVLAIVRLARLPGNRSIFLKLGQENGRRALPGLKELLAGGVAEGVMDVADVALTADLFLHVARARWLEFVALQDAAREGRIAEARDRLERRLCAEQQTYERLLGLPEESIQLPRGRAFEA